MALVIKKAETREEIEAAQRLSFEVISKDLKLIPKLEDFNRYDDCSIYFIAVDNNEIVGTMRLVSNYCTGKFPMEEGFELPTFIARCREEALEVSRAAIKKNERGSENHLILLSLLRAVYEHTKENNYVYLCACMFPRILKTLIEQVGWNFKWIGEGNSKMYGNFVIPVILEIKDKNVNFGIKK